MRLVVLVALFAVLTACKSPQQPRNADIAAYGKACMANVMAEHRAGRITTQQAEYGLAKCEQDANTQAQIRYLTNRP